MKKKSIFKASFEESLNLEDDDFLQYQLKEQDKKVSTPLEMYFTILKTLFYMVYWHLFSRLASTSYYWLFQQCFIVVIQKI